MPVSDIQIVVHKQSVVHSMVQFNDGSVIAQLASPDMRLPIQIALLSEGSFRCKPLDFCNLLTLTFEQCNFDKFPCARLGYDISKYPPLSRTVMNAANDVAVESFLDGKLSFNGIYNIILKTVDHFKSETANMALTVASIKHFDKVAKDYATGLINGEIC